MSIEEQDNWLSTPLGHYLREQEQVMYDRAVGDIFGFNAVQIGMPKMNLLQNSRIPLSFLADIGTGQVKCDARQLPFSSNCIDLLLLPHVLEFNEHPHHVLREAERVLVPEGHIVISGFNPMSSWGMKKYFCCKEGYPWNGVFISLPRIKDWLALLGFELVGGRMACHSPPFRNPSWLKKFQFMDSAGDRWWPMMGGVYFIVAKKRVVNLRLIRPSWNKSKLKSLVSAPSPTTAERNNGRP